MTSRPLLSPILSLLTFCLLITSVSAQKPKVVCFGDSITKRGYPEILGPLIGAEVVNSGVAGQNTLQGLKQIQREVLDHEPNLVIVCFGTNDLRVDNERAHIPLADFRRNLTSIAKKCKEAGAEVLFCTIPPIDTERYFTRHDKEPFGGVAGLTQTIADYRLAIIEVAAEQKAPVVDLNQILPNEPKWMHKDGVHPSPSGNATIAKYVAEQARAFVPRVVAKPEDREAAIIVYGATSSGITAAIQASRMNQSVILIGTREHLGGLTAGGLGATDIGNKNVIGGLSREFYRRVALHYAVDENWVHETREEFFANRSKRTTLEEVSGPNATMWTFEPHLAEQIFHTMLEEAQVPVVMNQRVKTVTKEGNRITSIEMTTGEIYRGEMFIDATYEGDLMARAKVSYRVGREANAEFEETLNGIRPETPKNQLHGSVDPYNVIGDPSSGLLPLIQEGDGGTPGEGDHRVQAYNFRLCFTDIAENRLPLEKPNNYDPTRYELAARQAEVIVAAGNTPTFKTFCNPVWMPNRKTDINNGEGISTDYIGGNYKYPDADYPERDEIWQEHMDYIQGFWYFMSHDERIPVDVRNEFLKFGPCKDEFPEADGLFRHMYVREARRMVSDYVMTEHNCRSRKVAEDPVGMAAYGMDSHNCQRVVQNGRVRNEGDVQKHGLKPYPISYRSIVPKAEECENLLVPVCVSATHIAFGSIRMEPVFMVLGQSSGTAAALALTEKKSVQEVEYEKLRSLLLAGNQVLVLPPKKKKK